LLYYIITSKKSTTENLEKLEHAQRCKSNTDQKNFKC
jgi:hypothetical protein